jgi:hypothetical protein
MNPYLNEEMAWQRLADLQREVENARLWRDRGLSVTVRLAQILSRRVWDLAGLAMRRPPRFTPRLVDDHGSSREVA